MPRGVANTIQITFMELKVLRPKLEDVGNAKAVTVKIAENVPHVKTNQNLEVSSCTQWYLGPRGKVCIIRLDHICFEKPLSTF